MICNGVGRSGTALSSWAVSASAGKLGAGQTAVAEVASRRGTGLDSPLVPSFDLSHARVEAEVQRKPISDKSRLATKGLSLYSEL